MKKLFGSSHVIPADPPANVKPCHAADHTEYISGHEAYLCAYPPSDPAEDRYAYQHEDLFHICSIKYDESLRQGMQ
jgi:hypothetical protein